MRASRILVFAAGANFDAALGALFARSAVLTAAALVACGVLLWLAGAYDRQESAR